jgi:hypothetical protein
MLTNKDIFNLNPRGHEMQIRLLQIDNKTLKVLVIVHITYTYQITTKIILVQINIQ